MLKRRTSWALLISVVVHVLILAWAALRSRDLAPVKSAAVQVDFTTTFRQPEPPPPEEKKAPEPPAIPKAVKVRPARRVDAPVATRVPDQAADPSAAPTVDQPLINDIPRAAVSLFQLPSLALHEFADAGIEVQKKPLQKTPEEMVNAIAFSTLGRGRVERGLVHPYYSQLGKALLKQWDADRVVGQGGLKNYADQFVQNTKLFNEIWMDRTEAFGKTGNPMTGEAAPKRSAPVNDRIQGIPGVDLEARKAISKEMKETFKATRRATIRVVQNTKGKLLTVELVDPSNDATVDNEALNDVRAAAEKLPAPPPEMIGSKTQIASLWSFELIISISPPVPTFSFEFDEALGTIDARLPLDRRIYKKVRLLSVE